MVQSTLLQLSLGAALRVILWLPRNSVFFAFLDPQSWQQCLTQALFVDTGRAKIQALNTASNDQVPVNSVGFLLGHVSRKVCPKNRKIMISQPALQNPHQDWNIFQKTLESSFRKANLITWCEALSFSFPLGLPFGWFSEFRVISYF